MRGPAPLAARLALAVVASAAACALTVALGAFMERNIFLLLFVAVAASAVSGGVWPGLLATGITSLFAARMLLAPAGAFAIAEREEAVRLTLYVLVAATVSGMGEALRAARRRSASRAAELLEQQARFRGVVEHLSEGVALTGPDGRVVYANGTMSELLGLGGAPLEGRAWAALMPDAPACGEETVWWEADHARGDGRQWLVGRVQPFRNADGVRVGTMHVLRDVTARRVAEEALRRSEEMLRQSQKMEAVGRVAGGVAHDFNNILAAVRLSASLLRMDVPPEGEAQESLAEIEEAVERASALVRQLMAFSRRQVLQPKPVDLNRVVEGMRRMLHRLVPSGVEVVARVAEGPSVVMADAVQLEQVLLNLCVNARDAMPHGGRLAVSVLRAGDEGPPGPEERAGWWLAVEDTGVGMDAATLQRVFEPFFTTRGSGGGTGLGLATVYGIVHQSGGELRVESVPGEGTVFHVFLPAPPPGAETSEAETADTPAGSVAG